jgi:hypothetical protein
MARDPEFVKRLLDNGTLVANTTPAEMTAMIADEVAAMKVLVETVGLKTQYARRSTDSPHAQERLTSPQTAAALVFRAPHFLRFSEIPAFFSNESLQSSGFGRNFRAVSGKGAADSIGKGSVR